MRQYLEVKERYPDCIVFFRLGDFYEMFFEDAVFASRALDLALTSRDKNKEDPVPMCGVPHHAARQYIGRLIELGRKVAICDQVEDARLARKIVRRAVTQVVTPGVVLEEEHLEAKVSHYLAAAAVSAFQAGLAYLDVSTGEFSATQIDVADLVEELCRIGPAELLIAGPPDALQEGLRAQIERRLRVPIGTCPPADEAADKQLLGEALPECPAELPPLALSAAAACVHYARATQPTGTLPLLRLRLYRLGDDVVLDEATQANLELFQTLIERKRHGSLLSVLDQTRTAMGGRLLRRFVQAPLRDVAAIHARHDAVEWLVERHRLREEALAILREVHDLERLTGRITLGVATPRDLSCLRRSLLLLPDLARALTAEKDEAGQALGLGLPALLDLPGADLCPDVAETIGAALCDEPPAAWREGGFIRRGYNKELDEIQDIAQGGKDHILRIEERERERTGIGSLKVRYNKVFGYYIEVTHANRTRVPADYIRKQTTANTERYVTPELSEYEAKVLHADERRVELELQLFADLVKRLSPHAGRLLQLAAQVAQIDALVALAETAHRDGWVRPEVDDGLRIEIEDGRHPVVERLAATGQFVPNDTVLDPQDPAAGQILIITGPNMAGKSTVMRQVALICLLSQMGSFVPARRARLGLVDRIFTRVGASDNLARGESTFMVEMRETASILRNATPRSLVVLDEIGRGTATYDGISIAWAVAEYLHDRVGCKTLFATHYHELCALAASHPRVRNVSVAVREWQGEIVFLHRLVEGGASRSYGIEVARLAGLPPQVVGRARDILALLEAGDGAAGEPPAHGAPRVQNQQLALFSTPGAPQPEEGRRRKGNGQKPPPGPVNGKEQDVLHRLRQLDCDGLTPRDALNLLAELREHLA
jgi:DNA mismatch repair protein MutS